jgi:hypothetical protein
VVTPGAQVRYVCEWVAPGRQPTVAGQDYWGPRDGVRWYSYSARPPKGFFQRQVKAGPVAFSWDRAWDEEPGHYTIIAEIRSRSSGPQTDPTYCYRSQQLGPVGAMLDDWLDRLVKHGIAPSPDAAEAGILRYRTLLSQIAKKLPPLDPAAARKHQETVARWDELASRLRGLLAATDKKRRIPVRAIHLETATQARRPLSLFLAELDDGYVALGKAGMAATKRWVLVDWTDPSDPRFRGTYHGEGETAKEAIASCLSAWDWDNRYPEGHLTFEVPPELRGILGGSSSRRMDTNGKSLTDEVLVIFQWIAIGGMLIAGFSFIFLAIPALASAPMAVSMLASTAGSVFSIGQRWRDGLFDWKADAIDGLTVVGNLVGTGVWARAARVRLLDKAGKGLDFVFLGTRMGTDAAQGILILESRIEAVDKLLKDPTYTPEERARKLLAVFAELTALGLMSAVSFRASAKEAEHLSAGPRHVKADAHANVPAEKLDDLTKPGKILDTTPPPIAEGHAKEVEQKALATTGIEPAPTPIVLSPEETEFAKFYEKNNFKWSIRALTTHTINLHDHNHFGLTAEVDEKTGDLIIVILTTRGSKEKGDFVGAEHLWAKELYPKMYRYFAEQGVEIKSVSGTLMWGNIEHSLPRYEKLMNDAQSANPHLSGQALQAAQRSAAEEAIRVAKTFKYHVDAGFGTIVRAKKDGQNFDFKLTK